MDLKLRHYSIATIAYKNFTKKEFYGAYRKMNEKNKGRGGALEV